MRRVGLIIREVHLLAVLEERLNCYNSFNNKLVYLFK
jgi:hypothetical protein